MKVITKNGLPLVMGTRVVATIRGEQYKVGIRGWLDNQYLILDIPSFYGEVVRLAPQTGVSVSFTLDGIFISFKTAVLHTFYQVVSLMILEFPRNFESYNLRRHQRQKAHFPLTFSHEQGVAEKSKGVIRDLSLKGALVVHDDQLQKGDRIFMDFDLNTGPLSKLMGEVRNVRIKRKGGYQQFVTGVRFVKPIEEDLKKLRGFVESRINDRRKLKRN